mmetsp:Transcript_23612/g.46955  ORF Transcript_23612/g.46955 Transcript_23612/m.46955 type:complete len:150 (-) Transcript_23612:144-593(-)
MKLAYGILFLPATLSAKSQHLRDMDPNNMLQDSHLVLNDVPVDDEEKLGVTGKYWDKHDNARCRTDNNKKGRDGKEYKMIKKDSRRFNIDDCEDECYQESECNGFEYNNPYGNTKTCELWGYYQDGTDYERKHRTKSESGPQCWWKNNY